MFYIEKDEKIVLFDTDRERLENTLQFRPDLIIEVEKEVELEVEVPESEIVDGEEMPVISTELKTVIEKVYPEIKETEEGYTIVDFELMTLEEAEERAERAERERLNMLSLTKREVFLALYKDKGITPEQIRATITSPEALIEFDYANDYFRGNPLIDELGTQLGYTTEQLDNLFEFGSFEINDGVIK